MKELPQGSWRASLGQIFFGRLANLFRQHARARRRFGDPARARFQLEPLEARLLLSADLVGSPQLDSAGDPFLPGDEVEAAVVVRNIGDASTTRSARIDLYASLDNVFDSSDVLLDSETTRFRIPAGASQSVDFQFSLPETLQPGEYSLVSVVDSQDRVAENSEANNVAIAPGFSLAWMFGAVPGHGQETLSVRDADGTLVRFSLSGPGTGEITIEDGEWDLELTGTNGNSVLTILTLGGGDNRVELDDVHVAGALGSVIAPTMDLTGTLALEGPLRAGLLIGSATGAVIAAPTVLGTGFFGLQGITILGDLENSEILIGADLGADGQLGGTGANADAYSGGNLGDFLVSGSMISSCVRVGQDPVDGIFDNGNDVLLGGSIDSVTVLGEVSGDSCFVAHELPAIAFIDGHFIHTANDPRFIDELAAQRANFSLAFLVASGTIGEAVGTASLTVVLTTDAPLTGDVTVDLAALGTGGATLGADYTFASPTTLTFLAGSVTGATQSAIVTITDDRSVEAATETADFSFGSIVITGVDVNVGAATGSHMLSINDNDSASVAITAPGTTSVIEGGVSASVGVTLTLTTSGTTGTAQLDVPVSANLPGNLDYTITAAVFAAGAVDGATANVTVSAVDDQIVEQATEAFAGQALSVTSMASASASTSQTIEVIDNDTAVYTINDVTVGEADGTLTFTVSVSNPVDIPVTIDVSYTDQTATGASGGVGSDYDNDQDQVVFAVLDTADKLVTVAVTDDNIVEAAETFLASLGTSTALAGRSVDTSDQGTGTIANDDANRAPVLDPIGDKVVNEEEALAFTALATDADVPPNTLTFSLDAGAPPGAVIDPNTGAFSWTPAEGQGPGEYSITIRVTDDGQGSLFDEETIIVTVNEVNRAPAIAEVADQMADEMVLFTLDVDATDPDLPANTLTYSLEEAPDGAAIDSATGVITWTPGESQDGTHQFRVLVSDNGSPVLFDIEDFTVTVNEVNLAPVIAAVDNQTTDEMVPFTLDVDATDADLPANTLTYSLDVAPMGATIDAVSGVITWTPGEAQDGEHLFTVRLTDNGTPSLSDTEEFTVTVNEVNREPTIAEVADQTTDEMVPFTLDVDASDPDLPSNTLTYALQEAPEGAAIDSATGVITWTPGETQDGTHQFLVLVSDNGSPELFDIEDFTVTVNEVNRAPAIAEIADQTTGEMVLFTLDVDASDPDVPANTLTYSLDAAPEGAEIDSATGVITWSPGETQDGTHQFLVLVSDNGSPVLFDTEEFTVTVNEVNRAPTIAEVADRTIEGMVLFTVDVNASDPDLPANTLTYSLDAAPAGAAIDSVTGVITWTPGDAQGGDHLFAVRVADNGTPVLFDTEEFTVSVNNENAAPVLASIGNQVVHEGDLLTFTALATDADVPPDTLTFSLDAGAPAGASIDPATGLFTWMAPEIDGAALYSITVRVTDSGTLALEDFETISVVVHEGQNVVFWDVGTSGSWSDAANWSGDAVPTSADVVAIDRPGVDVTVTVSGGAFTAHTLLTNEDLTISGSTGSLLLAGGATASLGADLSVLAGARLTLGTGSSSSIESLLLSGTGSAVVNQGELTLPFFDATNVSGGTLHNAASGVLNVASNAITVGGGVTLIEDGDISGSGSAPDTIGSFTVNSGGTATHSQGLLGGLSFDVTGALTVNSGGAINVTDKGYLGAGQPGNSGLAGQTLQGLGGSTANSGGSYGGLGGLFGTGASVNPTYGSVTNPTDLGSGGGRSSLGGLVIAGNGGGRVDISAGSFVVNGSIVANGGNGNNAGAGSGGSILLAVSPAGAGGISGSGIISANGGGGTAGAIGAGGGGRVAILDFAAMTLPSTNIRAYPGDAATDGAAGTVYLESAAQADGGGDLILDAGNVAGAQTVVLDATMEAFNSVIVRNGRALVQPGADLTLPLVLQANGVVTNQGTVTLAQFSAANIAAGTFHNTASGVLNVLSDAIIVGSGATLIEDGDLRGGGLADTVTSFTVNSGGSVTHSQGLPSGLSFTVTDTLTVNGSINATSRGYLGASNAGHPGLVGETVAGLTGSSGLAGGSYGGLGGQGPGGVPGATYGSTTNPTDLGSGGGRPSTGAFLNGGNGGGRIDITAGNIVVNGSILANGGDGQNAGGGSGGSIRLALLTGGSVSGGGTIQANGGSNLFASTSGGGGGRVAILDFAAMTLSSNNVRAFPGDAATDGAAGTVYLESAAQTDGGGDLIINAGNVAGARVTELSSDMASFNSVMVRNGRVLVAPGADVAVPLVLQTNGVVTNQGTLTLAQFSPSNITAGTFHNTTTGVLNVQSDAITVGSGVALIEDGDIRGAGIPDTIGAFTVNSGGTVTHSQGLLAGLSFDVTGALTVNAGGSINVNSRGFLGAGAAGNISFVGQTIAGQSGSTGNAGGSYGGLGGAGAGSVPNATYGSAENPTELGSGGGRTQVGAFVVAGNGGGRVDISAGSVVVNGSIVANGGNGLNSSGGSGGSILLTVGGGNVSGSGVITANGGGGAGNNGGGGGGRVAIVGYGALALPGANITAARGGGVFLGTAGSVFLQAASEMMAAQSFLVSSPADETVQRFTVLDAPAPEKRHTIDWNARADAKFGAPSAFLLKHFKGSNFAEFLKKLA